MTRLYNCLLLATLVIIVPNLSADEGGSAAAVDLFSTLDSNGDGVLDPSEIGEAQQKSFDRLLRVGDSDKDGKLTKAEYEKGLKPETAVEPQSPDRGPGGRGAFMPRDGQPRLDVGRLFQMADRDGDGKVAIDDLPEPMQERLLPLFERLGKDEITREDFENFRRMSGGRPEEGGPRPQMAFLRVLDEDRNGLLSKTELEALADKFSELDQNGDGQLGIGELMGFPGGMMARDGASRPGDRPKAGADNKSTDNKPEAKPPGSQRPRRPDGEGSGGDGSGGDGSKPQAGGPDGRGVDQFLKQNDKDGDGAISRDEAPERLADRFDRADSNGDGKLSKTELERAFSRRDRPE